MKLTGAAILASRGVKVLQAAPAAYPYRSAASNGGLSLSPTASKRLITLWLLYMVASLIHFIHNAEFLKEYPNLPHSWTRTGVYLAWLGMTAFGVVGLLLATRGLRILGLLCLGGYSLLGMDSLGHYVVAPFASHTSSMNLTILLEVCAAAVLLFEVIRQVSVRSRHGVKGSNAAAEQTHAPEPAAGPASSGES